MVFRVLPILLGDFKRVKGDARSLFELYESMAVLADDFILDDRLVMFEFVNPELEISNG